MILILKNIALIKNARIDLGEISLITGLNDSAKSTIGKVLVLLSESINGYDEYRDESYKAILGEIKDNIDSLNVFTQRIIRDKDIFGNNEYSHINRVKIADRLEIITQKIMYSFDTLKLQEETTIDNMFLILEETEKHLKNLGKKNDKQAFLSSRFRILKKDIPSIKRNLSLVKKISKRAYVKSLIKNIFDNHIMNDDSMECSIELTEYDQLLYKIDIDLHREPSLEVTEGDIALLPFKSVIYIETPLLLEYRKFMNPQDKYINKRLLKAFDNEKDRGILKQDFSDIREYIHTNIIKGEFEKNDSDFGNNDITFKRNDISYVLRNTATGIKSFGVIDMLLKNNALDDKTFLIVDEPEVHLHPNWKTEFSKLITMLAEKGVQILLTSHDHYIVKALDYYSKEKNLLLKTYLSDEKGSFEDVSDYIDKVYGNLSQPMNGEVWEKVFIFDDEDTEIDE